MVSSTSVERSHAITPSIEENLCVKATGTIESDEFSFPKKFIQFDKGSGMIFLPTVMWKGILLSGTSRKEQQIFYDIETLLNRDIDGAVRWSSLCSKLRRDFEKEGARTFSDSQWLGYIHRGSNKPRGTQSIGVNLEKAQDKGSQFWHTRSHAIILYYSVLIDINEKVRDTILYQRVPTPRPAPKIVLKNAWQVEHGKQTSSEQTCAEGDLLKINLRVQGVPQNAVLQDQGRRTTEQNLSLPTWVRHESSTDSVRDPKRPSQKLERSNCSHWEKFLRRYSAHFAPSTGQKDCYIAHAEYV